MIAPSTTAFLPISPITPTFTAHERSSLCKQAHVRRRTVRAVYPTNSPQRIPSPTPHTPYPTSSTDAIEETDSVETQFEQPPGGMPPPPTNDNWSGGSDDDSDLPPDLRAALIHGSLTQSGLARYKNLLRNPILAILLSMPAFRTRALADSAFMFKLLAQILIGNGTALASEIAVRGSDIVHELEYVASDLIVGTVVEAAFVWLLAPTLALPKTGAALGKFVQSLPAHAFQPSGITPYTVPLRVASFLYAGLQYAMIGFVAGIVGTGITYSLIEGRKRLDRSYQPERPLPDVLPNSVGWAAFMALSSNPRFQIVEGLELLFQKLCPVGAVVNGGIVTLRFVNNYWGGVQFVQFFRFLGLHATGETEPETEPEPEPEREQKKEQPDQEQE